MGQAPIFALSLIGPSKVFFARFLRSANLTWNAITQEVGFSYQDPHWQWQDQQSPQLPCHCWWQRQGSSTDVPQWNLCSRSSICTTCWPRPPWAPNRLFCGVIRRIWDSLRLYLNSCQLTSWSHRQKRIKQIKRKQRQGLLDPTKEDAFELFLTTANVRWTYYKDSHKVLGNTYGMCVLQVHLTFSNPSAHLLPGFWSGNSQYPGPYDRDRIGRWTRNSLVTYYAVLEATLLPLHGRAQQVQDRYAPFTALGLTYSTEAHTEVKARFNERFLLSLVSCKSSLILDDELNILPISLASRSITPEPASDVRIEPNDRPLSHRCPRKKSQLQRRNWKDFKPASLILISLALWLRRRVLWTKQRRSSTSSRRYQVFCQLGDLTFD